MDLVDEDGNIIEVGDILTHLVTGDKYTYLGMIENRMMTTEIESRMRVSFLPETFGLSC